jgi:hypothetical protein
MLDVITSDVVVNVALFVGSTIGATLLEVNVDGVSIF